MKYRSKLYLTIFIMLILTFSLTFKFSQAAILKQTIYSPYNTIVEQDEKTYDSKLKRGDPTPTQTSIQDRYQDFRAYTTHYKEPFCKIGGMYTIQVINDLELNRVKRWSGPIKQIVYDEQFKMYYCKSIRDIIERIEIPASWADDNLILYCNDGSNINDQQTNYDFLTTKMNTYKACIVKNLDMASNNTIVYGFEVGNKIVDGDVAYFYNTDTGTSPVLLGLTPVSFDGVSNYTSQERLGVVPVPYIENFEEQCYSDESGNVCQMVSTGFRQPTYNEALEYAKKTDPDIVSLDLISNDEKKQTSAGSGSGNIFDRLRDRDFFSSDSKVNYYFRKDVNWAVLETTYKDKVGNNYVFKHNSYDKLYTLSNNFEPLDTNINTIFTIPEDFSISRVAIFKKINDNYYYGYEGAIKEQFSSVSALNNSIKPAYIIDITTASSIGYTKEDCTATLASYDATFKSPQYNTKVLCKANKIIIISESINKGNSQNSNSFEVFKNIIFTIN